MVDLRARYSFETLRFLCQESLSSMFGKHPSAYTDLHEMVDTSQELRVDGQSAVQLVSRFGHESHCKLSLEHQHGTPEQKQNNRGARCLTWTHKGDG